MSSTEALVAGVQLAENRKERKVIPGVSTVTKTTGVMNV